MNLNSGIIHALCAPYPRLGVEGRGALTAPLQRPNSALTTPLNSAPGALPNPTVIRWAGHDRSSGSTGSTPFGGFHQGVAGNVAGHALFRPRPAKLSRLQ